MFPYTGGVKFDGQQNIVIKVCLRGKASMNHDLCHKLKGGAI